MPRVVNTIHDEAVESDVLVSDADGNFDANENTNQRIAYTLEPRVMKTSNPYPGQPVYYSSIPVNGEEDPYCLRRVVDGKVKKFKKDTRTWLHKSSSKIKGKSTENQQEIRRSNVHMLVPEKSNAYVNLFFRDQYSSSPEIITTEKLSHLPEVNVLSPLSPKKELTEIKRDEYMMYRNATDASEMDVDELVSSLGDSEAEISYSEASTPTRTLSYVDNWRNTDGKSVNFDLRNNVDIPIQVRMASPEQYIDSDFDERAGAVAQTDALESTCSAHVQASSGCRSCNESGNNVRVTLTRCDITQNIAPAILLEDESLKETQLDYLVNTPNKSVDLRTPYFTRQQSRARLKKLVIPKCFPQKKIAKKRVNRKGAKGTGSTRRAAKKPGNGGDGSQHNGKCGSQSECIYKATSETSKTSPYDTFQHV